jgi:hypothetical protein
VAGGQIWARSCSGARVPDGGVIRGQWHGSMLWRSEACDGMEVSREQRGEGWWCGMAGRCGGSLVRACMLQLIKELIYDRASDVVD